MTRPLYLLASLASATLAGALTPAHAAQAVAGPPQLLAAPAAAVTAAASAATADVDRIPLTAGRSMVLGTDFDVTRIAVTDPKIADAVVVQPREILVNAIGGGTTSLIVWGKENRKHYEVAVTPGISALEQQLAVLFPGDSIKVAASDEAVVLTGHVSNTLTMLRVGEIAQGAFSKAKVINLLQLPGAGQSQQVMLQVRFAEVNRSALRELGANLFVAKSRYLGRSTTQQTPAPEFDDENGRTKVVFSDFLNLFFYDAKQGLGAVIKALESKGHFQSLAEPNLMAYNGQEASFLAGGEFPVPIVQGVSGAVSVLFKEFGVRLSFKPTIAGDMIRLKVRPEVSSLDFNSGITLEGFRIPALTTRRAETDVELRDGQSFAIAGLLNNMSQNDRSAIPILSKLPIIGHLFKSDATRADRTELLVLITPRLVRPLDPSDVPALPIRPERFLPPDSAEPAGQSGASSGGTTTAPAPAATPSGTDRSRP